MVGQSVVRTVVCLCGSTRFSGAYQQANLTETLAGKIVLTIGCDMKADNDLFADKSPDELEAIKNDLDALHLSKIDLADEILVLNVGGYVGESTRKEIKYAHERCKIVRYLEPPEQIYVYKVSDDNPDIAFLAMKTKAEVLDWIDDLMDYAPLDGKAIDLSITIEVDKMTQGELDALPIYNN